MGWREGCLAVGLVRGSVARGGKRRRGGGVTLLFLAAHLRSPGGCGGMAGRSRLRPPPHGRQGGAALPPLPFARLELFGIPRRQARPGWPPVGQSGGGGVGRRAALLRGRAWRGGAAARGVGGRSASICPSASPGHAPKQASSALPSYWRAWPSYCTGSRLRAAAWTRSAGCSCAAVQDRWLVAGIMGAGGRQTGERAAYRPSGAPPRVPRPSRRGEGAPQVWQGGLRGRRPRGRPPAFRGLGGEGGEGVGGRDGAPCCPPSVPRSFPLVAAGGWLYGLGPGRPSGQWPRGVGRLRGGGRGAGGWAPGRRPALLSCPLSGHQASGHGAGPH